MKKTGFTLIEMVVVLAIIGLAMSIAVPAMRKESPERLITRTALEFQAFCARVRFQAMENAEDKLVRFDPDSSVFFMSSVVKNDPVTGEPDQNELAESMDPERAALRWKLPKEFNLENDNFEFYGEDEYNDSAPEMFRFFPDGGASGKRKLILKYKTSSKTVEISSLTGMTRVIENTENDGLR